MNYLLPYRDFVGSVNFSSADKVFYGKIVGVDDLVSYEGSSVKELNKAFQEAVDDYIKTSVLIGKGY